MAHTCSRDCHFRRMTAGIYVCTKSGATHQCGRECKAPKIQCSTGEYCSFTGCETYGETLVQYSNPISKDGYGRSRGGAHWVKDWSKRKSGAQKATNKLSHPCTKITNVLRNLLSSARYEAYLKHQRRRRTEFIRGTLHRTGALTFESLAALQRTTLQKFPGASKIRLPASHAYSTVLASTLALYSARNTTLDIRSSKAYVAAMLTLISTGIKSKRGTLIKRQPRLNNYLPPPNAMTELGIPCRSVSLAVRQLKRHLLGSTLSGIIDHSFKPTGQPSDRRTTPSVLQDTRRIRGPKAEKSTRSALTKQQFRSQSCTVVALPMQR